MTENEIEVVVMWRTTKLRYNDIAEKLNETTIFERVAFKTIKKIVKEQKELRIKENAKGKRVINGEMIVKMNIIERIEISSLQLPR